MIEASRALQADAVQQAGKAISEEESRQGELVRRLNEIESEIGEAKEGLSETIAERRVGEANEADVDAARDEVKALKEEKSNVEDEIQASDRAIEKLEHRQQRAKRKALADALEENKSEYYDALQQAESALEEAQDALDEVGQIGDVLAHNDFTGFLSEGVTARLQKDLTLKVSNHANGGSLPAVETLKGERKRIEKQLDGGIEAVERVRDEPVR